MFVQYEFVATTFLYVLVVTVAYLGVTFCGKSLLASNAYNPVDATFNERNYGPGLVAAREWHRRGLLTYANIHDPNASWWQWEPSAETYRQALLSGDFPVWDPFVGAGVPALTNLVHTLFFPPYFAVVMMGNGPALRTAYALLIVIAAGVGTYAVLRRHGLSWVAAFTGGLSFMLSGALVQNVASFLSQIVACLPWLILVTQFFLQSPTWRRTAVLSFSYAVVALNSFPPLLVAIFSSVVLYFVVSLIDARARGSAVVRFAAAVGLSLSLVAWLYVPAFFAVRDVTQLKSIYRAADMEAFPWVCFFQLLSPTVMGGAPAYAKPAMPNPFYIHLFYVGAASLFLSFRGFLSPIKNPLYLFAALGTPLILLKAFGSPLVHWIGRVPGASMIHFAAYFAIALPFYLAVLAAFGLERLNDSRLRFPITITVAVAGTVILAALWRVAMSRDVLTHAEGWRWLADFRVLAGFAALAIVLIVLATLATRMRRTVELGLLVLVAVEGLTNNTFPRQRRWNIWQNPPDWVSSIQRNVSDGRVLPFGTFTANTNAPFRVKMIDSAYAFNAPRIFNFYKRYFAPQTVIFLLDSRSLPPEPVLDAAAVQLVVIRTDLADVSKEVTRRGYQPVSSHAYVDVYRRAGAPPVFYSTEIEVVAENQSLERIGVSAGRRRVILEQAASFEFRQNLASDPQPRILKSSWSSMELQLAAPRPGLIYFAEAFFPGWEATVNGRSVAVLNANHAFRAVEIPQGDVTVRMWYRPRGLTIGIAISIVAALVGALLFVPRRRNTAETFES